MDSTGSSPEHPARSSFSAQSRILLGRWGDEEVEAASTLTQGKALFRKSLSLQKRNKKQNLCLLLFPVLMITLLVTAQQQIKKLSAVLPSGCECACIDADITCNKECSFRSSLSPASTCPIFYPVKWPPLVQVPEPGKRAPAAGCEGKPFCPVKLLATGKDMLFATNILSNLFEDASQSNFSDYLDFSSHFVLGTENEPVSDLFAEPAFFLQGSLYYLQHECKRNTTISFPNPFPTDVKCLEVLTSWFNSTSMLKDQLIPSQEVTHLGEETNAFLGAYDFLDSGKENFNMNIWHEPRSTSSEGPGYQLLRILRSINMISNVYLQSLRGTGAKMNLEYISEMPKQGGKYEDSGMNTMIGLMFALVPLLLFPAMLTSLVQEKQHKLRMMMKMHGLRDAAYWTITYAFFLSLSSAYMFVFGLTGSITGVNFFRSNSYAVQLVVYFVFLNVQIVLAFLVATCFSTVKAARVGGFAYVFLSALVPAILVESSGSYSSKRPCTLITLQLLLLPIMLTPIFGAFCSLGSVIIAMDCIPGISLYKVMKFFGIYASLRSQGINSGFQWKSLGDKGNDMKEVLLLMIVEWFILLPVAYYIDKILSEGGFQQILRWFLPHPSQENSVSPFQSTLQQENAEAFSNLGRPDVHQERRVVEQIVRDKNSSYAIVADNIKKVYPGRDGNPDKIAVRGLSLAIPSGECFGMLGPNGAGKTSFISMMIGHTIPTSGTAYVQGMDIRFDMGNIYSRMGVCPQFDLLWETLTAREHLLFYGRLKNLKGDALTQAVEDSLKSLNLYNGGVADKQSGTYSGGMKRRLSVAISLIGDPKVVYMDEPSTGLDPASRNLLWNVIKRAKRDRAIYLTTHSMEEAEALCDRLGFFVDGDLQCIGNTRELKSRYGGYFILAITTAAPGEDEEIESIIRRLSPNASKIYHIPGTQKFELPKKEARVADILRGIENAKKRLNIQAWGLSDTTLEDVFHKVAKGAMKS